MKDNWKEIVEYIFKSEECKEIHKFGSIAEGWIVITEKTGKRWKITKEENPSLAAVKSFITTVKNRNQSS